MDLERAVYTERERSPAVEWLWVALALAAVFVPGVLTFAGTVDTRAMLLRERRAAAPAPRPDWSRPGEFPAAYREWYARHFGLRAELLRAHAWFGYHALGVTPSDQLVLGEDGWVFTRVSRALDAERGAFPLTEAELERWRVTLEARRDWLASRGIDYLFVVAPDKQAIYPDLMPDGFEFFGESRRDQFVRYMHERSDVRVLDLTPAVRAERENDAPGDNTFFPLGTHWTARGAWAGYSALMEELATRYPGMEPWPRDAFEVVPCTTEDDVSPLLFLEQELDQHEFDWLPKREPLGTMSREGRKTRPDELQVWRNPEDWRPGLVLLHDSASERLRPLLAQHFSTIHADQTDAFTVWTIAEQQPDLVVQLYVDRFLQRTQPTAQTVFETEDVRAAFEASDTVAVAASGPDAWPSPRPFRGTALTGGGDAPLVMDLTARNQGFLVQEFPAGDADTMSVLRLDLTAPVDTIASVFYMEAQSQGYRHQRCETTPVPAGRSEVFFVLSSPTLQGPLLVRPGFEAGEYVIHDYEVRAIPR